MGRRRAVCLCWCGISWSRRHTRTRHSPPPPCPRPRASADGPLPHPHSSPSPHVPIDWYSLSRSLITSLIAPLLFFVLFSGYLYSRWRRLIKVIFKGMEIMKSVVGCFYFFSELDLRNCQHVQPRLDKMEGIGQARKKARVLLRR